MDRLRSLRRNRSSQQPTSSLPLPADADQRLVAALTRPGLPSRRQLRHVGKLLSRRERQTVAALAALAVASGVFLGVRLLLRRLETVPIPKGSYTEGVVGAPQFINPLLAQSNEADADIASLVFCGLFRPDRDVQPAPEAAIGYQVSPDGRSYVVQLHPGATWHDGMPVTADDVVFTYASAQDPDFRSPLSRGLRGVQVKKNNEREVAFTLPERSERALDLFTIGLLPAHLWGEIPPVHATLTEYNLSNPIGCGPWRFKSLVKDRRGNIRSYTLAPFAGYVGPQPYLQELTFKFYPEVKDAIKALLERNIDGVGYLAQADDQLVTDTRVKRYVAGLPQYTGIFFNPSAATALQDKNVRRALAAAVDRAKILSAGLGLKGEGIEGPLLPDTPGYDADLKAPAYEPAHAEALLETAGWQRVEPPVYAAWLRASSTPPAAGAGAATGTPALPPDGPPYYRKNRQGSFLEITLTTVDRPENVAIAAMVREFWQRIGVKVNPVVVPSSRIARDIIKPRNYHALLFGESYGNDPDPYPFWHSSQSNDPGLNLARVANRQIDQLLEEARASGEPAVRAQKYREFARLINAETPAVFLYAPLYTYAVRGKIKGVRIERMVQPNNRFATLAEWYTATGWRWK